MYAPLNSVRESPAVIYDAAGRKMMAAIAVMRDVFEITVGMRIVQRAVFAKILHIIRALQCVQHLFAGVGAAKNFAIVVKVQSPQISAAFGEQFEFVRDRVIAPNALLKFNATNMRRDRAALHAVKPAIRSPCQRVRERMRIFHPETREQNFGIAIRHIVAVFVGIKEQVRGLHHEHAAVADANPVQRFRPVMKSL